MIVEAIRRQSLTGHVTNTSSAMRKWKQLVRRCREGEQLSLELAGVAAQWSPMTPMGVLLRASGGGSGRSSSSRGSGVRASGRSNGVPSFRGYGMGEEDEEEDEGDAEVTPSFYGSPFPAAAGDRSSARRRLWGRASPEVSPVENVTDT